MKNPVNKEFQKKFDQISNSYENISNKYTLQRRKESLCVNTTGLLLEVGAASGIITEYAKNRTICTDISYNMCKQALIKHSSVICCDAEMLPFRKDIFDVIMSSEMIYYLENPEKFIEYSYKILKKNGTLLISMTNHDVALVNKIRSCLRRIGVSRTYFDDGLKEFMKIEYLKSLLDKYNFTINSVEKKVIFPFKSFDKLNRVLESTPLDYFCIFIIMKVTK